MNAPVRIAVSLAVAVALWQVLVSLTGVPPFEAEDVFRCLAEQLGVEYEYEEVREEEEGREVDLSAVRVPADLLAEMQSAADLGKVTELDGLIARMEQQDPETAPLAAALRRLSGDFRMSEVVEMLEAVNRQS